MVVYPSDVLAGRPGSKIQAKSAGQSVVGVIGPLKLGACYHVQVSITLAIARFALTSCGPAIVSGGDW